MKKNTILKNIILSKVPQKITLNNKIADIRKTKYLPSFSKEWKDTIYSYNKNTIKNIPSHHLNINKIIQSYFNLYFSTKKNNQNKKFIRPGKYITMKRRRNLLRKIYVSNPDIKYTNNKAIITLFTLNREKNYLFKKYIKTNKKIQRFLMERYLFLYKNNIMNIYDILFNNNKNTSYFLLRNKNKFIQHKLKYLSTFLTLKNLYLKKVWSRIIKSFIKRHLIFLRKYELLYSLNQLKFNKLTLLNKLSLLLNKILDKKVEYNIINIKSIVFNSDIFTEALTLKFQKRKSFNYKKNILSILGRVNFPYFKENTNISNEFILNKYKDGKILSYVNNNQDLDKFISKINSVNTVKNIHKEVFNSIQYKNIEGIRIETNGRLTKRYRADRAVHYRKWRGGLQKTSLNSTLFRGNVNPNISYSIANSTRRVGSFAIRGWVSGK
uniref:Ribosomal protein S3 n=1 Tax=Lecanicillium saksenae TaxID=468837 RepID=A0A0P0G6G8_9HYPO|nr:ribosomal protein S3 [Lecanicillium saksenae]ALJ49889.1 ribosomal protein S3 [Lecanicillium saksenae]